MNEGITWVGLDAHKESIEVAVRLPGREGYLDFRVRNDPREVRKLAKKLAKLAPGEVRSCYEAGPCGFVLARQLHASGQPIVCEVIAPSLIPSRPGDRVKTDRRDARNLADMLAAGLLTEVRVPDEEQEAVRDLCRCREDLVEDRTRARHQLSRFLARRGLVFRGGRNWTRRHHQWLRGQVLEQPTDNHVLSMYITRLEHIDAQLEGMDEQLEAVARSARFAGPVGRLCCFRGIALVTALTIVAELGDVRRFPSPRHLMSYLGVTPSEYSSGGTRRQGSITKAGNSHVRRVLVESSWHYRHRPGVGYRLRKRREGQPPEVVAIADRAQQRLHRRYRRMTERGAHANKAVVAVARELSGFLWAALQA